MNIPESLIKRIKESDQRITRQKETILSVLVSYKDHMLSAQEIMAKIPKSDSIDFATVYRNLKGFLDIGIVEQRVDPKGVSFFKLACDTKGGHHHHHFICLSCGKVQPIPCDIDYIQSISKEHGFEENYHTLEIFGKCKECLNKK